MEYDAGEFDIAVIGAGHAGCEAGLAAARLGFRTLVFSISLEAVANMPCNPHIGGSSKGHLVKELDSLGGEMGKNIDKAYTQIQDVIGKLEITKISISNNVLDIAQNASRELLLKISTWLTQFLLLL